MWAVVRAGGRLNGASPAYTAEEMTHALKTADSKIVMTLPSALPVALAAAASSGIPRSHVLLLEGTAEGFVSVQQLIDENEVVAAEKAWAIPKGKTNKEVCGFLNFSSGTTGLPKAVMVCVCLTSFSSISPGRHALSHRFVAR